MTVKGITAVLMVEAIEPSLPFWIDGLGFVNAGEVEHGDRLGFVMLAKDDHMVMLQTHESAIADMAWIVDHRSEGAMLFIEVDSVEVFASGVTGAEIVVPRRETFYGMDEVGFRTPDGSVVTLAARIEG